MHAGGSEGSQTTDAASTNTISSGAPSQSQGAAGTEGKGAAGTELKLDQVLAAMGGTADKETAACVLTVMQRLPQQRFSAEDKQVWGQHAKQTQFLPCMVCTCCMARMHDAHHMRKRVTQRSMHIVPSIRSMLYPS